MTDEVMSPLRRRMIEDVTIRKFAAKTQRDHVHRVKNFASCLGRSPELASFEDVRRYQLHLAASGAGVATLNQSVATLRFLLRVTLRRYHIVEHTHFIHEPRKLPVVLSPQEAARLLDAAPGLKYQAALSVAYGAGLRAAEAVALKVSDIDSKRMVIRLEQGKGCKGRKDCYVMLSPHLLDPLRAWWQAARPRGWLFPGRDPVPPMTTRQRHRACHAAAHMAEIDKRVSRHTLRHSFATHLLEQNIDVRVIQVLLGHAKLDATALYTRVATKTIRAVTSPLDHIMSKLKEGPPPAIANSRLRALDHNGVTFKWKDYRRERPGRYKVRTLAADEFIRRLLIHVLPKAFHRIRHYGLFAGSNRAGNIACPRQLLAASQHQIANAAAANVEQPPINRCPCCGGRMIIIERFKRGATPRHQPTAPTAPTVSIRIDTSIDTS